MTTCLYCTPEWLEESARIYRLTPKFQKDLEKVTTKVFYRIKAEPDWGIDQDIIFGAIVEKGQLHALSFYNEQDAKAKAEFIMSATPQEWKRILTKESKFLTDFMLGKVILEQGSKVRVLAIAPYANIFIDALTQVELKFQDDLSIGEREEFRANMQKFRPELGV